MTLSVLIVTCPTSPPQDSCNSYWIRILCSDKQPRIIFPLERPLRVHCRRRRSCMEWKVLCGSTLMVQKCSLERIYCSPRLKLPWAIPLAVLNPNKEQQRAQHFQRKGKSKSQLLPDRGFTLVSASCCFFILPSLLLSFLPPTQTFPDGCVIGWLKLTFLLQPLRHDLFFSRVRAHSPSIRWSGCEQVKLAGYHFQRSIHFSGKSKRLWSALNQKSKSDSLWLLASEHLISMVRVQGEEEGGVKTNKGKPHLKWRWEVRKGRAFLHHYVSHRP